MRIFHVLCGLYWWTAKLADSEKPHRIYQVQLDRHMERVLVQRSGHPKDHRRITRSYTWPNFTLSSCARMRRVLQVDEHGRAHVDTLNDRWSVIIS